MKLKAVFFDLDGTLLPMDQELFIKAYFKGLAARLGPLGYEPKELISAIWQGTGAMIRNDGQCTNEEAFWACFCKIFGEKAREDEPQFEAFYREDFQAVRQVCGYQPQAASLLAWLKARELPAVLATNPIFPAIATESRIRWAGLCPEDFVYYTTYENSRYCKPNPAYYLELLARMELAPEQCLMVGNDVGDDMVARQLGMEVFLLTDCLICQEGTDLSPYPRGGFPQLRAYLEARIMQPAAIERIVCE